MGVTIRDLARKLDLSSSTVSRALSGRDDPFISKATCQRVREAAKAMGYTPNRLARALVNGKTYTIGVLGIPLISEFHGIVVCAIEKECMKRGYHSLVLGSHYVTGKSVQWAMDLLLQYRVDGIIVSTWAAFDTQEIVE
ncbi:MAG: LacI family DNA-binding transcriptional regulator, partial [Armatimonadota bacterium]